ncbi:metallophosphoesterase [Geodermatophilus sp. SYSU D01176]
MSRWLKRIGAALGILLALVLVHGVFVEPRFILDEERAAVPMPRIDRSLAGTEVAVVSDFQLGMWFANTGMVEQAVETIVAAEPDVALLAGDFVYSSDPGIETQIDALLELLDPLLDSGIPTFAVLGNHDYAVSAADELETALEDAGVPVLRNEAAPVPGLGGGDGRALHVVGVGPDRPGAADVDQALADVPDDAPRVVLMHNPTVFPELPPGSAPLTLAGHTHCGQVRLPGSPRWGYLALTSEERIVADGWAPEDHGAEGNRMFVTCGIGFSLAPIRVNAPPQVAFFELRPGD